MDQVEQLREQSEDVRGVQTEIAQTNGIALILMSYFGQYQRILFLKIFNNFNNSIITGCYIIYIMVEAVAVYFCAVFSEFYGASSY